MPCHEIIGSSLSFPGRILLRRAPRAGNRPAEFAQDVEQSGQTMKSGNCRGSGWLKPAWAS